MDTLTERYQNKSVNKHYYNVSLLTQKKDSELPNYKSRLKASEIMQSYVNESRKVKRRIDLINKSDEIVNKINRRLPRRVDALNYSNDKAVRTNDLRISENYLPSFTEDTTTLNQKKECVTTRRMNGHSDIMNKYKTPTNKTLKVNFEKQSELLSTTGSNKCQSTKKLTLSISKLRANHKLIARHNMSLPVDDKDDILGLQAVNRLTEITESQTPSLKTSK